MSHKLEIWTWFPSYCDYLTSLCFSRTTKIPGICIMPQQALNYSCVEYILVLVHLIKLWLRLHSSWGRNRFFIMISTPSYESSTYTHLCLSHNRISYDHKPIMWQCTHKHKLILVRHAGVFVCVLSKLLCLCVEQVTLDHLCVSDILTKVSYACCYKYHACTDLS